MRRSGQGPEGSGPLPFRGDRRVVLHRVALCGTVARMDKSIRISPESHAALKKLVSSMGTLKAVAARAIASLDGVYVVVAELSEGTDIVEVYQHEDDAFTRLSELTESGVMGVSVASRSILDSPDPLRPFGPRWKDATGWTQPDRGGPDRQPSQLPPTPPPNRLIREAGP